MDMTAIPAKAVSPILSGPPRAALERDVDGVLHVVALSGGKDSTAMALRLRQQSNQPFVYVCTPTGDELPEMFAHWAKVGRLLGSTIWPLSKGLTLQNLIDGFQALPNFRHRWCTRMLKIEPYAEWLHLQAMQGPVVSYVGLRADEEDREGGDYRDVPNVTMKFPMREWGWKIGHVLGYLAERGVEIPRRTDCARCYHQTLYEWWVLWKDRPDLWAEGEAWEEAIGHTFRSPQRDTWPADMKGLRHRFEKGQIPKQRKRATACRVCVM